MKNNLKKSQLLVSLELGIYSNLYKDIYFDKYHGIKETQHNFQIGRAHVRTPVTA